MLLLVVTVEVPQLQFLDKVIGWSMVMVVYFHEFNSIFWCSGKGGYVAKVAEHSEAVSVASKAGKFKIASQKTGADKSVAKVSKLAESESVAEKAEHIQDCIAEDRDEFPWSSCCTSSRFSPRTGSTTFRRVDPGGFPHDLVPGQGSTACGKRFLERRWGGRGCAYGDGCTFRALTG